MTITLNFKLSFWSMMLRLREMKLTCLTMCYLKKNSRKMIC